MRYLIIEMSFYKMLLKNTILICLIFSLFITIGIYLVSYNYIKNEYVADANSAIDNISNDIEYNLLQSQGLPILFRSSNAIKNYVENDFYSSVNITNVYRYLYSTVGSMPNIHHNIAVTKIYDNTIISSDSSSSFDFFIKSYNISKNDINKMLDDFKENLDINTITLASKKNNSNYLVIFNYDRKSFRNDYFIISVYDLDNIISLSSNSIFSLQNNNKLLYCNNNTVIDKIDDKNSQLTHTVIAKRSAISDMLGVLTYTILIPKKQYFTFIIKNIIFIPPVILLLFMLSYIISKKISIKLYKPVERIINQINSISPSVIEDEFENITATISLITQQNVKYLDTIEKNQTALKDKFFQDLLDGFLSNEQIEAGIEQYLSNVNTTFPLTVVIVSIENNLWDNNINDTYNLNVLIYNLLKDTLNNSDFCNFTIISPFVYCILLTGSDNSILQQQLKQLCLKVESTLKLNINSYIGESFYHWEDMPTSFFSTYTSYMANYKKNTHLVIESSVPDATTLYPIEIENKIFSACISCQKTQLEQLLSFMFNKNIKTTDITPNMSSYLSMLFYSTCIRILTHLNCNANDVFGGNYNIYLELRNCHTFVEIHDKLRDILLEIIDYTTLKKTHSNQQYCDDMLEFINQNYNQDIALVSIAEYMNMSQAYVSKLFKRLTNYNFKEYLTKIRVDKGAELLLDKPDMSIKEISALVGYNNPEPFTKAFIQIHNISPSDYRKTKHK